MGKFESKTLRAYQAAASKITDVSGGSAVFAGLVGGTSSFWSPEMLGLDDDSRHKLLEQQDELDALYRQIENLQKEKIDSEDRAIRMADLYAGLVKKERFGTLLKCVNTNGSRYLLESAAFRDKFLGKTKCESFVMSIDIRRSTELMLKARSADAFASFTTELCSDLMEIVKDSYGVIDKFTGDGVLAYYPDFFSGPDAAYRIISAAGKCHAAFKRHYDANRKSFKTIYTNVGLGIGIDYGEVQLVQIAGVLTVVGEPVVYACRLSGASAELTLLNQRAYEQLMANFSQNCFVDEKSQEIKHEGPMLAYAVRANDRFPAQLKDPDWVGQIGVQAAQGDPKPSIPG